MILKRKRLHFGLIIGLVALVTAIGLLYLKKPKDFKYLIAGCAIYDKKGGVHFNKKGFFICIFGKDGTMIGSNAAADRITMFDKNDEIVWSANENVGHDMKFVKGNTAFLIISSELIQFENETVRSDCFSERDLSNKIIKQWCLGQHLSEMKTLGFKFRTEPISLANHSKLINIDKEISHANSIYEIGDNTRAKSQPAFAKGNYLVHLFYPSMALLILDHKMKRILWSRSLHSFKYGSVRVRMIAHDLKVTASGNILAYVNMLLKQEIRSCDFLYRTILAARLPEVKTENKSFVHSSHLIEFDPETDQISLDYTAEGFNSAFLGSVTEVDNGHLLYSNMSDGGDAVEIDRSGKIHWSLKNQITKENWPNRVFQFVRPLDDESFLHARESAAD